MTFPDGIGFDRAFYVVFLDGCQSGGIQPEHLLGVLASESSLIPTAYNANGGAQGLSQLMPQTLRNLHVSVDGFKDLPPQEQILTTFEYFRYWRNRFGLDRWTSRAQLYLANFMPALLPIATVPDFVIVDAKRAPAIYRANTGLDANKDNQITMAEMEQAIVHATTTYARSRYDIAMTSLSAVQTGVNPIVAAQTALGVTADGIWGPKSVLACKLFQAAHGLVADGIVGPLTMKALLESK